MPSWNITCSTCGVSFVYVQIGRKGSYKTDFSRFRFCEESREKMKESGYGYSDVLECSKMRQAFEAATGSRISGW